MSGAVQWYRLLDVDPAAHGCQRLEPADAASWNAKGWGVFATCQEFEGARRKENLARIRSWSVDIDDGSKEQQARCINGSPLVPSTVVETRRGYQVHFHAADATPEAWDAIVRDRLVPHFKADQNASDVARIMRVPGYLHQKDPANPFRVQVVHRMAVTYRERDMLEAFEDANRPERERKERQRLERAARAAGAVHGDDFFERLYNLDHRYALERLSGHAMVSGEKYTFRRTGRDTLNILVDGKGSSCWLDTAGRIGSKAKGGPTAYQWLAYFGHRPREIVEALKALFPELTSS